MKCADWERLIAGEVESAELEEHLIGCVACRAFAREMEENRAALAVLSADPAACDAVRARVLAEIRLQRRRRAWWIWPAAVAACAALVVALMVARRFGSPAPPRPVEFAKAPKLMEWTAKPSPSLVRRAARVRPRPAPVVPQPVVAQKEPLVVKMLTNDPDVIIVWLIDQKGDAL